MPEFRAEFIAEFVARTARACASWASALNHEIRDDAVEDESVIERSLSGFTREFIDEFDLSRCEADEVFDGIGDEVFVEFCSHIPEGGFEADIEFASAGNIDMIEADHKTP